MPFYEWVCNDCEVIWERECDIGKAPDRTRCPECKKLSNRHFDGSINVKWGDDKDFHTVKQRYRKHAQYGYDKTAANRWLNRSIAETKSAMADDSYRYMTANIKWDKLAQDGLAREVTGEEKTKLLETRKNMTEDAYNRANKMGYRQADGSKLDPTKPRKPC